MQQQERQHRHQRLLEDIRTFDEHSVAAQLYEGAGQDSTHLRRIFRHKTAACHSFSIAYSS